MSIRKLRVDEIKMIEFLLKDLPEAEIHLPRLKTLHVEELNDGGMGSLKFLSHKLERKFGKELAVGQFHDEDDVQISIAINVDNFGEMYEVDVWKVDFSPLIKFPRID